MEMKMHTSSTVILYILQYTITLWSRNSCINMVNVDDTDDWQWLRCCVIKIKKLCSEVIKGYSKHYKEINSHPLPEKRLNEIKLLFDQHIEHRCAKYNLTKEKVEQWDPSNKIVDNNEWSNTNNKSEEHDSDKINIYTTSRWGQK